MTHCDAPRPYCPLQTSSYGRYLARECQRTHYYHCIYCKFTFSLNIAFSVNDCTVGQHSSIACAVYIARILASVRAPTSIAQVSTQRILHCAIIHATRNVQTEGKLAVHVCDLNAPSPSYASNINPWMYVQTCNMLCQILNLNTSKKYPTSSGTSSP